MHFESDGFLVKRRVIPQTACQKVIDFIFRDAPKRLVYGAPESYKGFSPEETRKVKDPENGEIMIWRIGQRWRERRIRFEEWVWTEIINHPAIRQTVEALIGPVHEPNNVLTFGGQLGSDLRGVYANLPGAQGGQIHIDRHPFDCGMVILLDDVPPNCGCFSVYPGTQQQFPKETRDLDAAQIETLPPPFVFHGQAGDTIFWDSKLAHQEQPNTSKQLRLTLFHDWVKRQ